jgi:hypothetical protein
MEAIKNSMFRGFAIGAVVLFSYAKCGLAVQQTQGQLDGLDTRVGPLSLEEGYIYVVLSEKGYQGTAPAADSTARSITGLREIADRSTGMFAAIPNLSNPGSDVESHSGEAKASEYLDLETQGLKLLRVCSASSCLYSVTTSNSRDSAGLGAGAGASPVAGELACPPQSFPTDQTQLALSCNGKRVIHLTLRSSLPITASEPKRKPHTSFEFLRLGPIYTAGAQVVPFIANDAPLVISVDPQIDEQGRTEDVQAALNYWNRAIGFKALTIKRASSNADTVFAPTSSYIRFHETSDGLVAAAGNYSDPVTGQILGLRLDLFPASLSMNKQELQATLAHEIGHALGLAHNFAASADPLTHDSETGSSVMDYYAVGESPRSLSETLIYDQAAMDWIYRGEPPNKNYLHCNDLQAMYIIGCDRFDPRFGFEKKLLARALVLMKELPAEPLLIKRVLENRLIEGSLTNTVRAKISGDAAWVPAFLLDPVAITFLVGAAYKYSAFSANTEDAELMRKTWFELFEQSIAVPGRGAYTSVQLQFLESARDLFEAKPLTSDNLTDVLKRFKSSGL